MVLRYIKIFMLASIALFFTLVSFNNVTDYNTNWLFVKHVLSMDTTFHDSDLMWRAITNETAQKFFYIFIIIWEIVTALLCWTGVGKLGCNLKASLINFHKAKTMAYLGLFSGFMLYMFGFIVVGGEWFSMWQSDQWNGQGKAGLFISLIMLVFIFLAIKEQE